MQIYSPTAVVSSLSFHTHTCTHTSLLPSSATDQAFCPGLLFSLPSLTPPHLLLSSSHLALLLTPNTGGIHGEDHDPKHLLTQQAFCGPFTGARRKRNTFLSRCLDTESWSFFAGRKAWFLPGLDHWHCGGSIQCRFLSITKEVTFIEISIVFNWSVHQS